MGGGGGRNAEPIFSKHVKKTHRVDIAFVILKEKVCYIDDQKMPSIEIHPLSHQIYFGIQFTYAKHL